MNPVADLFTYAEAKERGIAIVAGNNNAWVSGALLTVQVVAAKLKEFTADDIREAHLDQPKHANAWGALLSIAAKKGLIEPVGFTASKAESTHGRIVRVWRKK